MGSTNPTNVIPLPVPPELRVGCPECDAAPGAPCTREGERIETHKVRALRYAEDVKCRSFASFLGLIADSTWDRVLGEGRH